MVTITEPTQPFAGTSTSPESDGTTAPKRSTKPLDIVFLQDTTGSQDPYIDSATKAIRDICEKISTAGQLDKALMRFGLIAFRDHPPQDRTYVTKNFGFTNDMDNMHSNLSKLEASGGGDGPEAQTAALAAALNMKWTKDAVKMVILITDAPPHGLGELGDGFAVSPDQNDPLVIARQMAERGITLFVIACEPTLSTQYKHAVDFYEALTQITSGQVFPLLLANQLGDYIVGTALETIETEKLIDEFEKVIIDEVYNNAMPVEKVAENLQQYMEAKGTKINSVVMEDVYSKSETSAQNQQAWSGADNLAAARGKVKAVAEPRLLPQFLPPLPRETGSTRGMSYRGRGMAMGRPFDFPYSSAMSAPMGSAFPTPPAITRLGGAAVHGWGEAAAPGPAIASPSFSVQSQQVSHSQAQRIVMQSVARSSAVTSAGMFSKASGQAATSRAEQLK